jgi:P2-related tail formation protein
LEWFDYGGDPYHFKVEIDVSGMNYTEEQHAAALAGVQYYKNLRSHLDAVWYISTAEESTATVYAIGASGIAISETTLPPLVPSGGNRATVRVATAGHSITITDLPELAPDPVALFFMDDSGEIYDAYVEVDGDVTRLYAESKNLQGV